MTDKSLLEQAEERVEEVGVLIKKDQSLLDVVKGEEAISSTKEAIDGLRTHDAAGSRSETDWVSAF